MINKINATVLFVKDFDESVKFYKDILGFSPKEGGDSGFIAFDVAGLDFVLMDLTAGCQMISEDVIQPKAAVAPRFMLASFLDDTDSAYEQLKSKGVHFIKPPTTQPWGQRTAYFSDPDGNIWEISHFPPTE